MSSSLHETQNRIYCIKRRIRSHTFSTVRIWGCVFVGRSELKSILKLGWHSTMRISAGIISPLKMKNKQYIKHWNSKVRSLKRRVFILIVSDTYSTNEDKITNNQISDINKFQFSIDENSRLMWNFLNFFECILKSRVVNVRKCAQQKCNSYQHNSNIQLCPIIIRIKEQC